MRTLKSTTAAPEGAGRAERALPKERRESGRGPARQRWLYLLLAVAVAGLLLTAANASALDNGEPAPEQPPAEVPAATPPPEAPPADDPPVEQPPAESGAAEVTCAATGDETITTDKEDYDPADTVHITGKNYAPSCDVVVKITRPDGSVIKGDGTFQPGSDTVTIDESGNLAYDYVLKGIAGEYRAEVLAGDGSVLATAGFSDSVANDCFRTVASGNWNATSTWESAAAPACTSWSAATLTPTNNANTITIRNGHTVTVTAAANADQMTIETGGQLTINNAIVFSLANGTGTDLTVNGALQVSGSLSMGGNSSLLVNGTGSIPSGGAIGGINIVLTIGPGGQLTNASTGNGSTIAEGIRATGSSAGLVVNGTLLVPSGEVLAEFGSLQVNGTATVSGTGVVTSTRGNGGPLGRVNSGGTMTLSDTAKWTITGNANAEATVASGGTLAVGPSALVDGGADFILASGANLEIGSTAGITSSGATGNVQNTGGGRSYDTGASYTYNGTAAQTTGNGLPGTVNNLTIDNGSGVTLNSTAAITTVSGTLTLTDGQLNAATNGKTVHANTVARTDGYVVGDLRKLVSAGAGVSRTFEVGTAAGYAPVDVAFANVSVAGNLTARANAGDHGQATGANPTWTLDETKSVNLNWTLTGPAPLAFTTYAATFGFNNADLDAGANTSLLEVGKLDAGSWTYPTVGTRTSTSTQATGIAGLSSFQLASPSNTAPTCDDDSAAVDEDQTLNDAVVCDDVDADTLAYTLVQGPDHDESFTFNPDGTFTYTPEGEYGGPDSFTFKANDGSMDSNVATFDITVTPVDDPAVAGNDTATVDEDFGAVAIDVLLNDTDVDGGPKAIESLTAAANGSVAITNAWSRPHLHPRPRLLQRRLTRRHLHLHPQRRLHSNCRGHRQLRERCAGGG